MNDAIFDFEFADLSAMLSSPDALDAANEDLFSEVTPPVDEIVELAAGNTAEASDSESWLRYVPHVNGFADY